MIADPDMLSVGTDESVVHVDGETYPGRLYKQGMCADCGIPLFGRKPHRRALCGHCQEQHSGGEAA